MPLRFEVCFEGLNSSLKKYLSLLYSNGIWVGFQISAFFSHIPIRTGHSYLIVPCTLECFFLFFFLSFFLGPHPWHIEIYRLGVKSELQLVASATATAIPDPSCVCDLHHSSQQNQILNPLSEPRDRTRVLMDTSRVHYH